VLIENHGCSDVRPCWRDVRRRDAPIQIAWPQLQPYYTNLDKAKQLAEAGNLNGFEATGSRNPNEALVVDERSSAEVPAAPLITSAIPVTFRLQRSPKATKPLMMRRGCSQLPEFSAEEVLIPRRRPV